MAYSTGSYTDQNDALNLFATFLTGTAGYTQNDLSDDGAAYAGDVFTGRRLHVQKNINGTDYFFNFRSCSNQRVFEDTSYTNVTGICVNGSTGYNAGNSWDTQPGHTEEAYASGTSDSIGGSCRKLIETGGTYHFFATPTVVSAAFQSEYALSEFQFITIGATDLNKAIYACSAGQQEGLKSDRSNFAIYLAGADTDISTNIRNFSAALYDGTGWLGHVSEGGSATDSLNPAVSLHGVTVKGDYASAYVENSPDPFRGNAPLPPCATTCLLSNIGEVRPSGVLDGVHFINMKNYSGGQEITIGSDVFKCFRINDNYEAGVAFKK